MSLAARASAAPPGTFNDEGDDPAGADTRCETLLCRDDERALAHTCVPCAAGTISKGGADASGDDTRCSRVLCRANEHVAANACVECAPGTTNLEGDNASGVNTQCDTTLCGTDQRVEANSCVSCPPGTTNLAGDNASGANTSCDVTFCRANQRVKANSCVACVPGATNVAGDDASGANTQCDGPTPAVSELVSGVNHTCALRTDGAVKCWGDNVAGQLGLGDANDRGDEAGEMGDDLPEVNLGSGRTAAALAAGGAHTCALLDDGALKCWGDNQYGQLGLGDTESRGDNPGEMGDELPAVDLGTGRTAIALTAGENHTCALFDNGAAKFWGKNGRGQLGIGDRVWRGDEAGEMGDNLPAVDLGTGRTVAGLNAEDDHTCALLDNGALKCWGSNRYGVLGLGNGRMGDDLFGNRGDNPGEMGDDLPAVDLGAGRTAIALSAGGGHACALLYDGALKCWGSNDDGQLGIGDSSDRGDNSGEMGDDLPTADLGTGRTAVAVTADGDQTCARLDNGAAKCWGNSSVLQFGPGGTALRGDEAGEMGDNLPALDLGTGRTAVALAAGVYHTCALLDDGALKCWGYNISGVLGLGDIDNRGDNPGEMGDNLPAVDLGH
ncbi:MAG: hypothetical protein RJA70_2948 [Pseudomonadota bacterium]